MDINKKLTEWENFYNFDIPQIALSDEGKNFTRLVLSDINPLHQGFRLEGVAMGTNVRTLLWKITVYG